MAANWLAWIVPLYNVSVGVLAFATMAVGVTALMAPNLLRLMFRSPSCMLFWRFVGGVALMLVGVVMAVRPLEHDADPLLFPRLVSWLGLLVLLKGVLCLALPSVADRVIAFHAVQGNAWFRFLGGLCLVFAVLFFLATNVARTV
ncbi:MAG TPA: hypothetical protein PLO37_19055 [Candidatus Hydrogenedentes bacterium]|nr:hypothetical protein [Candidatus Hydrogenedentota bacterium]HPG68951.1 hypothetical protein [Candidatus Hydrogenedentota bacterium]